MKNTPWSLIRSFWMLALLGLLASAVGVLAHAPTRVVSWGMPFANQTNTLAGVSDVIAVAAGQGHCLALRSDGSVLAWGVES
jgi:hypothetical protein